MTATDATFNDMLKPLPEPIRSAALELRRIIRVAIPDADEGIYGGPKIGMALYSIAGPNNVICGIQPTGTNCKLFFHGWEALVANGYKLEGSGKHARHVKLCSPSDIDAAEVTRMLAVARTAIGR